MKRELNEAKVHVLKEEIVFLLLISYSNKSVMLFSYFMYYMNMYMTITAWISCYVTSLKIIVLSWSEISSNSPLIFFQVREAHVMQDIQRKMKRSHAEYEATIQALKVHVHIHL